MTSKKCLKELQLKHHQNINLQFCLSLHLDFWEYLSVRFFKRITLITVSLSVKNNSVDLVTYHRLVLNKAPIDAIIKYINPNLFNLSGLGETVGIYDDNEAFVYPELMRLTKDSLKEADWCLLDDGLNLYLYILKLNKK